MEASQGRGSYLRLWRSPKAIKVYLRSRRSPEASEAIEVIEPGEVVEATEVVDAAQVIVHGHFEAKSRVLFLVF